MADHEFLNDPKRIAKMEAEFKLEMKRWNAMTKEEKEIAEEAEYAKMTRAELESAFLEGFESEEVEMWKVQKIA